MIKIMMRKYLLDYNGLKLSQNQTGIKVLKLFSKVDIYAIIS
jgi:hypothetical protein